MTPKEKARRQQPDVREQLRERDRIRNATPERKAKKRVYEARRWAALRRLTPDQVATLLAIQNAACAVCGVPVSRSAHVDHDHDTQQVRGLLCVRCNQAEGLIKSVGLTPHGFADRLQDYLDNPPAALLVPV